MCRCGMRGCTVRCFLSLSLSLSLSLLSLSLSLFLSQDGGHASCGVKGEEKCLNELECTSPYIHVNIIIYVFPSAVAMPLWLTRSMLKHSLLVSGWDKMGNQNQKCVRFCVRIHVYMHVSISWDLLINGHTNTWCTVCSYIHCTHTCICLMHLCAARACALVFPASHHGLAT